MSQLEFPHLLISQLFRLHSLEYFRDSVHDTTTGRTIGGIPFTRGSLAYLLHNCFYIGEVKYKGEVFQGEQAAILDRKLFEDVQSKLDQQRSNYIAARHASDSLLMDRIFDGRGNRMTPTHATKAGVRYRYYISTALIQGQANKAATLSRVPAAEIEQLVVATVRQHVRATAPECNGAPVTPELNDKDMISTQVVRVDVKSDHLVVRLAITSEQQGGKTVESDVLNHDDDRDRSQHHTDASTNVLTIPWKKTPARRPRAIIPPVPLSPRPDKRPSAPRPVPSSSHRSPKVGNGSRNGPSALSRALSKLQRARIAPYVRST